MCVVSYLLGFNSMKVRLKHRHCRYWLVRSPTFQFHEGPIKTAMPSLEFQRERSFNSMKVRLKREWLQHKHLITYKFQFHEGPIKTSARGDIPRSGFVSIP